MEWIVAVETLVEGYNGGIKVCNLTFKEIHRSIGTTCCSAIMLVRSGSALAGWWR